MSREIRPEDIESGNLTIDEVLYLQDRGLLPADIEPLQVLYSIGGGVEDPLSNADSDSEEDSEEDTEEDSEDSSEED